VRSDQEKAALSRVSIVAKGGSNLFWSSCSWARRCGRWCLSVWSSQRTPQYTAVSPNPHTPCSPWRKLEHYRLGASRAPKALREFQHGQKLYVVVFVFSIP